MRKGEREEMWTEKKKRISLLATEKLNSLSTSAQSVHTAPYLAIERTSVKLLGV